LDIYLARAFHKIYSEQKKESSNGRDFIGLRDYYSLLKLLRDEVGQQKNVDILDTSLNAELLSKAVARNLGGKPSAMHYILSTFHEFCIHSASSVADILGESAANLQTKDSKYPPPPTTLSLIKENLSSRDARHLMLLTLNDSALYLLFGCKAISESNVHCSDWQSLQRRFA